MTSDVRLRTALNSLRKQWRRRQAIEAFSAILAGVLLGIMAGWILLKILEPGPASATIARVVAWIIVAVMTVKYAILPFVKQTSDERFAMYVEERSPKLKQSLITAISEINVPAGKRISPSLTDRLSDKVSAILEPIHRDGSLESIPLKRAFQTITITAITATLLLFFGPYGFRDASRIVLTQWNTAEAASLIRSIGVEPGNITVPRGSAIDISAELVNFSYGNAELVFRADSTAEWVRIPMQGLPVDSTVSLEPVFTTRLFDISAQTEYYVESADVRSAIYSLSVSDLPAVSSIKLELTYPSYTGLPSETIEGTGDIVAVKGTKIRTIPAITREIRGGLLRFDTGNEVQLKADSLGTFSAEFTLSTSGFYSIDLLSTDGRNVAGRIQYAVDVIPDRVPIVRIDDPGRDTKVNSLEEVTISARSDDDFGVMSMELLFRVNGGEEKSATLMRTSKRDMRQASAAHTLYLEEYPLEAGDLIAYHVAAKDGAGNIGLSDVYFLEIRPFSRDYRQAEEQGGGGGGEGGGGGNDSPDGFVARQKEIVAGTFNWQRDSSSKTQRQRNTDITTLTIAQGRVREDVKTLIDQLQMRGMLATDTLFSKIQDELKQAHTFMGEAEELLGQGKGGAALLPEQKALQHSQRAQALYRDVQVQMGGQQQGGGGGGGGSQSNAEDLADLFELQTDKLRNQYEAVQQSSQQSTQQEVDETIERLRQLASRQQQENERLQRMQQELSERLGQQQASGGGNSSAQRELAKQAEEEARRLERLARERNSPELRDAAQRMQQAADAMRRAATGSNSQGNAALEELNRASRNLEQSKADGMNESVRNLAERARELQNRQEELQKSVNALGSEDQGDRREQLRRLDERKRTLASDVGLLEEQTDRLARETRRDQPGASRELSEAAESMREQRLRDRVEFSRNVIRGGSSEYANAFEEQITDAIASVAEQLNNAEGALTAESQSRRQERALSQTRDLVRDLESLRERSSEASGEGQNGTGSSEQQGSGGQGQRSSEEQAPTSSSSSTGGAEGGSATGRNPEGDARQMRGEFRLRRQNAEALRRDLIEQGMEVRELDRAISDLRRLEEGRPSGDPQGMAQLQEAVIEGLKTFEFSLFRSFGLSSDNRPALGARSDIPPEFRSLVEEYYRSIADERRRP